MRVISVVNLKGGVGKTTTAVNMAAILARDYQKPVVVFDCDPQANATSFFGVEPSGGVADILTGRTEPEAVSISDTEIPGVCIVPGSMELVNADICSMVKGADGSIGLLHEAAEWLSEDLGDELICIMDCPPSFTAASCAAIYASDDVIIPVKPDGFVLDGSRELVFQIEKLRELNPGIGSAKLLITMWQHSEAVIAVETALRDYFGDAVYQTTIRRTLKVDESTIARQTLDTWSPYSSAGKDYRAFVSEFLRGGAAL